MKKVAISEVGMATRTMRDERHSRRNRKSTRPVTAIPARRSRIVSERDDLMKVVSSEATTRDIPAGSVAVWTARAFMILFVTATTLASLALTTCRPIACFPSILILPTSSG